METRIRNIIFKIKTNWINLVDKEIALVVIGMILGIFSISSIELTVHKKLTIKQILIIIFTIILGLFLLFIGYVHTPKPTLLGKSEKIAVGVYTCNLKTCSGEEDDLTLADIQSYESLIGRKVDWVYFSHNWYKSYEFPLETVEMIHKNGNIPFIRMMLRHKQFISNCYDPIFNFHEILSGKFDPQLRKWFTTAASLNYPLLVVYGIEFNSDWFTWSGQCNGGGEKSVKEFIEVYRKLVNLSRDGGAFNISWVWQVNDTDTPNEGWNHFEHYYPGNNYVDIMAFSAYGCLLPNTTYCKSFSSIISSVYPRLISISNTKPIIVAELGIVKDNKIIKQEQWVKEALEEIYSKKYLNLVGFSWWNEAWENSDKSYTTMKLQDNKELVEVFNKYLK